MVSAAIGAEQFYTQANNEARREGIQEARELDAKTRDAWVRAVSVCGAVLCCPLLFGMWWDVMS